MLLFSSLKNTVQSYQCGARDNRRKGVFIHHIGLKFNRRPRLGGREFLLQGLVEAVWSSG